VQISYLGYPGSSGGRYVDYIIADDYTLPAGQEAHFPEKIIRIPPTYQINDYAARWLPPAPRRTSLGLPAGAQVLGMFNNVNKVTSTVWAAWMETLKRAPKSLLWMLDPGEVARLNLTRAAEAAGVGAGRILFAPRARQESHMARLQLCDLILDPWPYGGHTTTGDALFAGVPVVVLEGSNFASRVSGGLLVAAGLKDLVRPTMKAYIDTVISLLNQPDEIVKIRRHLLARRTRLPVFDAATRTRQLEAAFRTVHERRLGNLPAQHVRVGVNAPATHKKDAA
jgi:predicted O-linked N-acetylglucosamine transferase (SPINDLY family)